MKIKSIFKNITIKQANILTLSVIFLFSIIFVALLVEEMYEDYESAFEHSILVHNSSYSDDELLEKKQKALKSFFIKIVLVIVTLTFILFAIFLGLNNIFNRLLQRDTQTFLDFFEKSTYNYELINSNKVFFKDFKIMIGYANKMLEKITKQKKSLLDMNEGLEDRVKQRTLELEKSKIFSQKLLSSQKEFLRYTVHETNTPLSVILTSIELYLLKHPKDRQLSKIEVAVKNIFSIYDDLSYLVKKDQLDYPKTVINLQQFLSFRLDFFSEVAELSRVKFNYIHESDYFHIYFNKTKLQRIVDNTITNAIKYTLLDEIILVKLSQVGSRVQLSVSSKSKTIKNTDKVFNEFYREENTSDGFGLGLGLVRNICQEEGVDIKVYSNDEKTSFSYKFKIMAN